MSCSSTSCATRSISRRWRSRRCSRRRACASAAPASATSSSSHSKPAPAAARGISGTTDLVVDRGPTGCLDSAQGLTLGVERMERRTGLTLSERLYLPQIVGGLMIIIYRFWRNLIIHALHAVGLAKNLRAAVTVQYPDE